MKVLMEKTFCQDIAQDITDDEFTRLDDSEKDSEFVAVESKTYFQDAWGRFKKNKLALVSLVFMAVVILFAPVHLRRSGSDLSKCTAKYDTLVWNRQVWP